MVLYVFVGSIKLAVEIAVYIKIDGVLTSHQRVLGQEVVLASDKRGDGHHEVWNGPAGVFECDDFTAGSRAIGEAIAEATAEGAFSLIGGGDSVACVNKFGLADKVSYISTGGGALLEAIEGKVLPGVAAIKGE